MIFIFLTRKRILCSWSIPCNKTSIWNDLSDNRNIQSLLQVGKNCTALYGDGCFMLVWQPWKISVLEMEFTTAWGSNQLHGFYFSPVHAVLHFLSHSELPVIAFNLHLQNCCTYTVLESIYSDTTVHSLVLGTLQSWVKCEQLSDVIFHLQVHHLA